MTVRDYFEEWGLPEEAIIEFCWMHEVQEDWEIGSASDMEVPRALIDDYIKTFWGAYIDSEETV